MIKFIDTIPDLILQSLVDDYLYVIVDNIIKLILSKKAFIIIINLLCTFILLSPI